MWGVLKTENLNDYIWLSVNLQHKENTFVSLHLYAVLYLHFSVILGHAFRHLSPHWSVVFLSLSWLSSPWVFGPLVLETLHWQGYYEAIRDINRVCLRKEGLWIELISSCVLMLHWQCWANEHSNDQKNASNGFINKNNTTLVTHYFYFNTLMFTLFLLRCSRNLNTLVICSPGSYNVFNTMAGLLSCGRNRVV